MQARVRAGQFGGMMAMRRPLLRTLLMGLVASIPLAATIFLLLACFDLAVSLMYARQEQTYLKDERRVLQSLLHRAAARLPRSALVPELREHFGKDHLVKEDGDDISVDNVVLKFRGDVLVGVCSAEDSASGPCM